MGAGVGVGEAEVDGLGEAVGTPDWPDWLDCPSDCASSSSVGEGLGAVVSLGLLYAKRRQYQYL